MGIVTILAKNEEPADGGNGEGCHYDDICWRPGPPVWREPLISLPGLKVEIAKVHTVDSDYVEPEIGAHRPLRKRRVHSPPVHRHPVEYDNFLVAYLLPASDYILYSLGEWELIGIYYVGLVHCSLVGLAEWWVASE